MVFIKIPPLFVWGVVFCYKIVVAMNMARANM